MDLGLTGKVAFVAGASAGLGYAAALALAQEGAHVALCSRSAENINAAAERLQAHPEVHGSVLPVVCDVTDETQLKQAFADTVDRLGVLHVLVTNAGGPPSGFIEDFSADQWRTGLELNLVSTINMCRHALPHLRQAAQTDGHARVIMITSVSAKQPIPNLYISNTARAGVQGFCKSLATELGPEGITVNTVLPGFTKTERLSELVEATQRQTGKTPEEIYAGWAAANALKRIGAPEEFASAVAYLASRPAAYITGTGLLVDGGRVKGLF